MLPPICQLCYEDIEDQDHSAGLVSFKLSPEEKAINDHMEKQQLDGHPKGLHWFCGKHIGIARKYSHLTSEEAFPLIEKECGSDHGPMIKD